MAGTQTRTETFLFSDIEGSTRLLRQLGEAYPAVLDDHHRLLRAAFTAHRGQEQGTEGDSFFVVFPVATEAIAAAVDAQLALARREADHPDAVRVRIGIHTGDAMQAGSGYIGLAVHEAARISAVGHGGQIVVSEATKLLTAGLPPVVSF
jgi:class 3 adenylate cyclase